MLSRFIYIGLIFFTLISCGNNSQTRLDLKTEPLKTDPEKKQFAEKPIAQKTAKPVIEMNDLKNVLKIIREAKLINTNIPINNTVIPSFSYMSPTAMLEMVIAGRESNMPEEMKVLNNDDDEFMIEQERKAFKNGFKWKNITGNLTNGDHYPQYQISVPVFSLDKKKFIICIEKYTTETCFKGRSWMFIVNENKTEHYRFDGVDYCK